MNNELEENTRALARYYPRIFLEGLRETTKTLSDISLFPERESNGAPSDYSLENYPYSNLLRESFAKGTTSIT
jgi:hypothetical protein